MPSVDCEGGQPPDAYTAAAYTAICSVLPPLAALDGACSGTPGAACAAAARQLVQGSATALRQIGSSSPGTTAEKGANSDLRTAFQDYSKAGSDIATGVSQGSSTLIARGMAEVTAGTAELSAAGAALSG